MKYELFLLTTASETTPASVQLSSVSAGKYRKILGVLKNNVDGNLNAEEIARLCLLGVSNMKKIFRQYAGCGVMDYYKKLRIIRACELLKSGVGVADISEIMNFSSPNYFTMTFKREMGVPPSKYLK